MNRSVRRTVILLVLVVAAIFALVVAQQMASGPKPPEPAPDLSAINAFVYDEPRPLAAFSLTNEQGESVTDSALTGHWTFVFVGYTSCPDICPATMATLRRMNQQLPTALPQPEYLLVSADPERDTPQRLKDYLGFFGEDFHGLTGDLDTLRAVAQSVGAVFVHRDDGNGNTLVDHSGHLALLNPDGQMIAVLQPPHDPEKLIRAYQAIYQWAHNNLSQAG